MRAKNEPSVMSNILLNPNKTRISEGSFSWGEWGQFKFNPPPLPFIFQEELI